MVRTPLARRIHLDETLNSVALFLPHYDSAGIEKVVARLQDPDYEYVPPVDVELSSESVTLQRASGSSPLFEALERVPSYIVPSSRKTKQTRRLMKMARALVKDELDVGAITTAEQAILSDLDAALVKAAGTDDFSRTVDEKSKITYGHRVFDVRTGQLSEQKRHEVATNPVNINHLFDEAGRLIGEGLHLVFWQHRTEGMEDLDQIRAEKIKVSVLLHRPDTLAAAEKLAAEMVAAWHKQHVDRIDNLAEERAVVYEQILGGATEPVESKLDLGERLLWRRPKAPRRLTNTSTWTKPGASRRTSAPAASR